jgi:hypothetical protein
MRLLGPALQRWWRRARNAPDQRPSSQRLGYRTTLTIPASFERQFEGWVTWCTRNRGVPLDRWERWLVRSSFRFTPVARLADELPTPAKLLEELADKVIGQIERLAVTGFRAPLDAAHIPYWLLPDSAANTSAGVMASLLDQECF